MTELAAAEQAVAELLMRQRPGIYLAWQDWLPAARDILRPPGDCAPTWPKRSPKTWSRQNSNRGWMPSSPPGSLASTPPPTGRQHGTTDQRPCHRAGR